MRGEANVGLTAALALQLGMAAGDWLRGHPLENGALRRQVVLGRDTRLSGDMLASALSAGLTSVGIDVIDVGIVPTPAVAQIVLALRAQAGVVISASHNPFEDNGIKFFGPNGRKLPDTVEDEIAARVPQAETLPRALRGEIGHIRHTREPIKEYTRRVMATMGWSAHINDEDEEDDDGPSSRPLSGMRLVVDCANGAAYEIAPELLMDLGAEVSTLHTRPDGININVNCGSTHPTEMASYTLKHRSDAGLAFDGDADRVILADETGRVVDGDQMMAIIALHLAKQNQLPGNVVVATIMSNVGLEQALGSAGIRLHRTDVGDRYVAEAMEMLDAGVGGEQSGHILLPHLTPTGDGLVTALQVLAVMRETARPLSALADVVQTCPQLLKNVRVKSRQGWQDDPDIKAAISRGRARLANPEWLSVRPSGTEPLLRVMAQGTDAAVVQEIVNDICTVMERKLT